MKNRKIIVFGLAAFLVFWTNPALAQENSLTVNKTIRDLNTTFYRENVESGQHVFRNNEQIEFQIKIENKTGKKLSNIKVTEKLPQNVSLIFNPGTYDQLNRTISWTIDTMDNNTSRVFAVRARVTGLTGATGDSSKRTNEVEVRADQYSDTDQAYYYVGGTTLPVTGNEDLIFKSVVILAGVGAGLYLRKKGRGF